MLSDLSANPMELSLLGVQGVLVSSCWHHHKALSHLIALFVWNVPDLHASARTVTGPEDHALFVWYEVWCLLADKTWHSAGQNTSLRPGHVHPRGAFTNDAKTLSSPVSTGCFHCVLVCVLASFRTAHSCQFMHDQG